MVDQTIEDGIGERRISKGLMPVLDGELARDDRGAAVVAIFQQFQQIPAVFISECGEPPIIEDQHIGLRQGSHQLPIASIPLGNGPLLQEPGQAEGEGCKACTAGPLAQSASDPRFAHARWPRDQYVVPGSNPRARRSGRHQGFVQPTRLAIVEVFETGRLPQFGLAQAGGEAAVLALRELTIDEEPEAFFKAEGGERSPWSVW